MAETLTELVAKIKTDATELEKGLTDAERKTEASSKKMSESLQKVGMAMAASGAAITAALGLMGKAAIDEEINIKRLATTINNSGTAYDSVKDSLEAVIATTQRKTGIADDEQRNILNRLILVTNDYDKALSLLPTVLDLAAAGEMDATTAATYLGKAYLELEEGAEEVSVRFGQASLQFKNMEDIQKRVAGAAVNLANPLSVLRASIGDVAETIGANLVPIIKGAIDRIVDIAIKVQDWAKEHPELARVIVIATTVLGILLGIVGSAILIIPKLVKAWAAFSEIVNISTIKLIAHTVTQIASKMAALASAAAIGVVTAAQWLWNAAMTANPIGILIVAIGALVVAIVSIAKSWDWVREKTIAIWNAIGGFLKGIWDNIVDAFKKAWGAIGDFFRGVWEGICNIFSTSINWIIDRINSLIRLINKIPFVNIGELGHIGTEKVPKTAGGVAGLQHGGIIEKPTLALMGEQAPAIKEAVIPETMWGEIGRGNVIIQFTQPVFFDREDTMNKFVDMIRKGIQRQDRLRFGGAYSGS